jgi:hypothetical protein
MNTTFSAYSRLFSLYDRAVLVRHTTTPELLFVRSGIVSLKDCG